MVAKARDGGALLDGRLGRDRGGDEPNHDRLGNHLTVHAPPGASGDGRTGGPGGGGPGPLHPRLRDVEDLSQQRAAADVEDARADARRCRDRPRRARRRGLRIRGRAVERRRAGSPERRPYPAGGPARLHRGDGAEDAGTVRRDRGRLPDALDHDSGLRALHAEERRRRHRHRLHDRRLDPRERP